MQKEVDIQSQAWCDLVFENRNKEYGAYAVRRNSRRRQIIAIACALVIALLLAFLPGIMGHSQENRDSLAAHVSERTVLADFSTPEEPVQPEQPSAPETVPAEPLPPPENTVRFVVPKIVASAEITADNKLKSQFEVSKSKASVAKVDFNEGVDRRSSPAVAIDMNAVEKPKAKPVAIDKPIKKEPVRSPDVEPEFPGGYSALGRFLSENIHYPQPSIDAKVQGQVTLEFVVDENGLISRVKVVRGLDSFCDAEAIRVVRSMPKWKPGRKDGVAVASYFILPVTFRVS